MSRAHPSLAEQRRELRQLLDEQRQRLAQQLASGDPAREGFPRSVTVRWLIEEPELVTSVLERILGRRVGGAVPVVLIFARFLRSAATQARRRS